VDTNKFFNLVEDYVNNSLIVSNELSDNYLSNLSDAKIFKLIETINYSDLLRLYRFVPDLDSKCRHGWHILHSSALNKDYRVMEKLVDSYLKKTTCVYYNDGSVSPYSLPLTKTTKGVAGSGSAIYEIAAYADNIDVFCYMVHRFKICISDYLIEKTFINKAIKVTNFLLKSNYKLNDILISLYDYDNYLILHKYDYNLTKFKSAGIDFKYSSFNCKNYFMSSLHCFKRNSSQLMEDEKSKVERVVKFFLKEGFDINEVDNKVSVSPLEFILKDLVPCGLDFSRVNKIIKQYEVKQLEKNISRVGNSKKSLVKKI